MDVEPVTAAKMIKILSVLPGDTELLISSDEEGNHFHNVQSELGYTTEETIAQGESGLTEEDLVLGTNGKPVAFIYPWGREVDI